MGQHMLGVYVVRAARRQKAQEHVALPEPGVI
jgi:hypothetical protein